MQLHFPCILSLEHLYICYNGTLKSSKTSPGCTKPRPCPPLPRPHPCPLAQSEGMLLSKSPCPCPLPPCPLCPHPHPPWEPDALSPATFRWSIAHATLSWITISSFKGVKGMWNFWRWTASRIWAVFKMRSSGLIRCSMTGVVISVHMCSW